MDEFNPDDPRYTAMKTALMRQRGKNSYSYLSRPRTRVCPVCGEVFETLARGRPKRFCSEKCRIHYHHKHPNPANWTSTRIAVCPVCGGEFQASREYIRQRKYCSRACANKGRTMEAKGHLLPYEKEAKRREEQQAVQMEVWKEKWKERMAHDAD